jgi:hypothetical protein
MQYSAASVMLPEARTDAIRQTRGLVRCDRLATLVQARQRELGRLAANIRTRLMPDMPMGIPGLRANKGPGGGCRWVFPGQSNVTASAATGFGVLAVSGFAN